MDENHPTQDAEWDIHSEPQERPKAWGRAVSTSVNPDGKKEVYEFHESKIEIGRRNTCLIRLTHPAISNLHCFIERTADNVVFLNDTSTNGTHYRGHKIGKGNREVMSTGEEVVLLQHGSDRIAFTVYIEDQEDQKRKEEISRLSKETVEHPEVEYINPKSIGTGAFAEVFEVTHCKTGVKYALKVINKKQFALNYHTKRKTALQDETEILSRLNHHNIVKCYKSFETDDKLYLVLELVNGGDLFDRIVGLGGGGFPEAKAKEVFYQLVKALEYLHRNEIVHRDLKPENILLADKNTLEIKLTDFGLARVVGEGSFMQTLCGTPQYLAPEVLVSTKVADESKVNKKISAKSQAGYDKAVDLWSAGVILYVLLSGTAPFSAPDTPNRDRAIFDQVLAGRYSFPPRSFKNVSNEAKDLIRKLLCVDVEKRATVDDCLNHPWMADEVKKHIHSSSSSSSSSLSSSSSSDSARKRKQSIDDDNPNPQKKQDTRKR